MTVDEMLEFEETHDDEFLKFERIPTERKLNNRPDLNAFILLDKLVPGNGDIVVCSEHDEIFLGTDLESLAQTVTEENIIDLIRCGVRFTSDGLCMFT
jgi:hypothetical protein